MPRKAEDNYAKHQNNPGPSKESLNEQNDEKAGRNINWVIVIAVVLMVIAFYFIFRNSQHSF